jgi:hypothetical protein
VKRQQHALKQDLPPNPRIRYTRKSTQDEGRQIASHEQQTNVMNGMWGVSNTDVHFQDDYSGTTFDRPEFTKLEQFCFTNKRPDKDGVIEVYDMTRFGRILINGEENPIVVVNKLEWFNNLGWQVKFCNMTPTGNPLMDFMQQGMHSYMAASYSKKLSFDVRRGRNHFLTQDEGTNWMGGAAPFGTKRVDPANGEELRKGQRAGRGGTLLVAVPEEIELLIEAGNMLLNKATYMGIADFFNARGARTEEGRRWNYSSARRVLSNRILIGEMHVDHVDPKTGSAQHRVYPTTWGPLMPVDHFNAVYAEVVARSKRQTTGTREDYEQGLLEPICGRCGGRYYITNRRGYIYYQHPSTNMRLKPEWHARIKAAGCKSWAIPAREMEQWIKNLILERRTSPDFVQYLNTIITDRGDLEVSAEKKRAQADRRLKELEREQQAVLANMTKATTRGMDDAMFWTQLDGLNVQIEEVRKLRSAALDMESMANTTWERVRDLITETRNLEAVWELGSVAKRREIIDWWVRQVVINVAHEEGKLRSSKRVALAFLRTAPTEGIEMLIGDAPVMIDGGTTRGTTCST